MIVKPYRSYRSVTNQTDRVFETNKQKKSRFLNGTRVKRGRPIPSARATPDLARLLSRSRPSSDSQVWLLRGRNENLQPHLPFRLEDWSLKSKLTELNLKINRLKGALGKINGQQGRVQWGVYKMTGKNHIWAQTQTQVSEPCSCFSVLVPKYSNKKKLLLDL